jgi:hypothetical protein
MKYKLGTQADTWHSIETSALNGNLEVPVYFLKAKQVYTVKKYKKDTNGCSTNWQVPVRNSGTKISSGMLYRSISSMLKTMSRHYIIVSPYITVSVIRIQDCFELLLFRSLLQLKKI